MVSNLVAHPTLEANPSRWPHRWAVLLVCVTFPLIWVGGLVTTHTAGMAVPDWPSTYGYNLFLYPWQEWFFGPWDLFIEHGHRLLGATSGLVTIGLLVSIWRCEDRRWMKWLGVVTLLAVIGQGMLGGMRVMLDARQLAKIHGCVGPAFFALCVAMAMFTSRRWRTPEVIQTSSMTSKVRVLAWATLILAYCQLVLGAHLRHLPLGFDRHDFRMALVLHIFVAFALLVHGYALWWRTRGGFRQVRRLYRPSAALAMLLTCQIALGCGTWITNYGWPVWFDRWGVAGSYTIQMNSQIQSLTTTAHVAMGSLILATALMTLLASYRFLAIPKTIPLSSPAEAEAMTLETVS